MSQAAKYQIQIRQIFTMPVETLFACLADHTRFGRITGAEISVVKTSEGDHPCGIGSVRRIKKPLVASFDEQITEFVENQRIEYRVCRGSPLKDHHGQMMFSPLENGSLLEYQIVFNPKLAIPGWGWLLQKIIQQPIASGLKRFAAQSPQDES